MSNITSAIALHVRNAAEAAANAKRDTPATCNRALLVLELLDIIETAEVHRQQDSSACACAATVIGQALERYEAGVRAAALRDARNALEALR